MVARRRKRLGQAVGRIRKPETARPTQIDSSELDEYVGYALRKAQVAFFGSFIHAMRDLEVRPAEFAALVVINANHGLTQSALAATLGIDRSAGVIMLDRLEGMGLAQRVPSPTDRRSYSLVLSKAGKDLLAVLIDRAKRQEDLILAEFSDLERKTLLTQLRKLSEKAAIKATEED